MNWTMGWTFYLMLAITFALAFVITIVVLIRLITLLDYIEHYIRDSYHSWRTKPAREAFARRLSYWEPRIQALSIEEAKHFTKSTLARPTVWNCIPGDADPALLLQLSGSIREFFTDCVKIKCGDRDASLQELEMYDDNPDFLVIGGDIATGSLVVKPGEDIVYETHANTPYESNPPFESWKSYPSIFHWFLIKDLSWNSHPLDSGA